MKVLMVCLGNICRSPMAEGILRDLINTHNLDWEVDSCGTIDYHAGKLSDPRTISKCKEKGIDILDLRSRQFEVSDFKYFDIILAMDNSNFENLSKLTSLDSDKEKIQMILDYYDGETKEVPDPYYGSHDGFEEIYHLLNNAITNFIQQHEG